ncbi:MAG: hypothetical protein AB7E79_16535 [Rhodospirillaceae bacterium]
MKRHPSLDPHSDSGRARARPWLAIAVVAVAVGGISFAAVSLLQRPAAVVLTEGGAPAGMAARYQLDQAERTLGAHGYHGIVDLARDESGAWRGLAQKDGARWRVQLSPRGSVTAQEIAAGGS